LIPLCGVDLTLGRAHVVGDGPSGRRLVAPVTGMVLTGERLRASLVGPAADWVTLVDDVATIDVRATVETDDGAIIYVQYAGRADATGRLGAAPVYVAPRFETGDDRYRWLNVVQAAGKGDLAALHYDWYELR
jgi:hypothetical protein